MSSYLVIRYHKLDFLQQSKRKHVLFVEKPNQKENMQLIEKNGLEVRDDTDVSF